MRLGVHGHSDVHLLLQLLVHGAAAAHGGRAGFASEFAQREVVLQFAPGGAGEVGDAEGFVGAEALQGGARVGVVEYGCCGVFLGIAGLRCGAAVRRHLSVASLLDGLPRLTRY